MIAKEHKGPLLLAVVPAAVPPLFLRILLHKLLVSKAFRGRADGTQQLAVVFVRLFRALVASDVATTGQYEPASIVRACKARKSVQCNNFLHRRGCRVVYDGLIHNLEHPNQANVRRSRASFIGSKQLQCSIVARMKRANDVPAVVGKGAHGNEHTTARKADVLLVALPSVVRYMITDELRSNFVCLGTRNANTLFAAE